MPDLLIFAVLAAGAALLFDRARVRRRRQLAAANATGLAAIGDLTHVPTALQRTALWRLADGGFERSVVHGVVTRGTHDLELTAFDLETLRERRGEWAWLPVEPPFRIAGLVTVAVCELDRDFPHALFKRRGVGDELRDDSLADRLESLPKNARDALGVARSYPAELPALPTAQLALATELPSPWRGYCAHGERIDELLAAGFATALAAAGYPDLAVELIENAVVVYATARAGSIDSLAAVAADLGFAALTASPTWTPRGIADRAASSGV